MPVKISVNYLINGKPNEYYKGFKSDLLRFSTLCNNVWAPVIYSDGYRQEKSFVQSEVLALDFDNGMSLDGAVRKFAPFRHIIGTTKSHGINGDRFRVLLFFTNPITSLDVFKQTMKVYTGIHKADKACKDGARFFYPCKTIISVGDGQLVWPELIKTPPVAHQVRTTTSLMQLLDVRPAKEGMRNRCAFAAACKFFRAGLSEDAIYERVSVISNGLPREEINKIMASAKIASGKN
jgi:hypothetical protein